MMFQFFGVLFLSVVVIPSMEILQRRCSGDQITWINESGHMIGCSPCPACPPGSEYSIPCSTKAINGTPTKCIPCPPGKFSNQFNKKPCVACTRCSRRYIKKVCTLKRNSLCGGCAAGYYYNEVSFSCEECGRCCKDGKDQAPLGCARVGLCKTRPYSCPNIRNDGSIPTNISWTSTKSIDDNKLTTLKLNKHIKSPPTPTSKYFSKSSFMKQIPSLPYTLKKDDKDKDSLLKPLLHATVALLTLIILLGFVAAAIKFCSRSKGTHRPILIRSTSYSTSTSFMPKASPEDRTLEEFFENDHDAVDRVCFLLYDKLKKGMWDFERVSLRFGLNQEERIYIRNHTHIEGANPTRALLELLCTKRPKITVRQFAEIAKIIKRNDVYDTLQHFFYK